MIGKLIRKRKCIRTSAHYNRWYAMCQRCSNPLYSGYKFYGAKGISIDPIWSPDNPNGLRNFDRWLDRELRNMAPTRNPRVSRRDVTLNFGPDNCFVGTSFDTHQKTSNVRLTGEDVVRIRAQLKADPDRSIPVMAKALGVSLGTIYNALTGRTWSNMNTKESPINWFPGKTLVKKEPQIERQYTVGQPCN